MAKITQYHDIQGHNIPFNIYTEYRTNVRYAFGKTGINVRLPKFFNASQLNLEIEKAKKWVAEVYKKKPAVLDIYIPKQYDDVSILNIYNESLHVVINHHPRKSGTAKYLAHTKTIVLVIPHDMNDQQETSMVKTLLSRICASIFLPDFEKRVREINDQYFKKEINTVRLKYNKSNWGSCSNKKNLNFSTRLLFAPPMVRDYVIIHELAHLIEMNHSKKFWDIVHSIMPNYKTCEEWLDKNGKNCDF